MIRAIATSPSRLGWEPVRNLLDRCAEFHPEIARWLLAEPGTAAHARDAIGGRAEIFEILMPRIDLPGSAADRTKLFAPDIPADIVAFTAPELRFRAPIPELWEVPPGAANVVADHNPPDGRRASPDLATALAATFPNTAGAPPIHPGLWAVRTGEARGLAERFAHAWKRLGHPPLTPACEAALLNTLWQPRVRWLPFDASPPPGWIPKIRARFAPLPPIDFS